MIYWWSWLSLLPICVLMCLRKTYWLLVPPHILYPHPYIVNGSLMWFFCHILTELWCFLCSCNLWPVDLLLVQSTRTYWGISDIFLLGYFLYLVLFYHFFCVAFGTIIIGVIICLGWGVLILPLPWSSYPYQIETDDPFFTLQ